VYCWQFSDSPPSAVGSGSVTFAAAAAAVPAMIVQDDDDDDWD